MNQKQRKRVENRAEEVFARWIEDEDIDTGTTAELQYFFWLIADHAIDLAGAMRQAVAEEAARESN